jgi:hypothetical protein
MALLTSGPPIYRSLWTQPPEWAEGLYYNKGLFSEALIYHDDEALYFEVKGKDDGIVRLSFEMLETLKVVIEEEDSAK